MTLGKLVGPQVTLQTVRGTRQIAPEEGIVTKLPVNLDGPGTYDIEVRMSDRLKVDTAVTVPDHPTN